MIPMTEIHPMRVHFPIVLWIRAEVIAVITLSVFALHTALRTLAIRLRYPLTGIRGWCRLRPQTRPAAADIRYGHNFAESHFTGNAVLRPIDLFVR